jgi:hypothetical protein
VIVPATGHGGISIVLTQFVLRKVITLTTSRKGTSIVLTHFVLRKEISSAGSHSHPAAIAAVNLNQAWIEPLKS